MITRQSDINTFPQMSAAFNGWRKPVTFTKITETVVEGDVELTETSIQMDAVIQPLDPEEVELKPEGQRAWQWLQIHGITSCNDLSINDRIVYNSIEYKVMAVKDYSLNNYVEYHITKDYQD